VVGIIDAFGVEHTTIIIQAEYDKKVINKFINTKWIQINPDTKVRSTDAVQYKEFMNVETWLHDASTYDLCISFRIHGSMTFIGSGVPTVILPTDFRIMELIYAMKLPHVLPNELDEIVINHFQQLKTKPETAYKQSQLVLSMLQEAYNNMNFTEFEKNRRDKIKGWKSILNAANLEMDPSLLQIISRNTKL
jgi:hypothetical protein